MAINDIMQDDTPSDRSPELAEAAGLRKPWSTPVVIVSDPRNAGAHVAVGSDGSSSGYQYGS